MSLLASGNLDPGRLDRRVQLLTASAARDAAGGQATTWTAFAEVWAARAPLSGARLYAAEQKNALDLVEYRIRHRNDVAPYQRLQDGDDLFEIVPPTDELGRRHLLRLTCRAINQTVGSRATVAPSAALP